MSGLEQAFRSFCSAGRKEIDCRGFISLCRECELISQACPDPELERIFQRFMSVSKRRIDLKRFEGALQLIAERVGASVEEVHKSVVECRPNLTSVQCSPHRGRILEPLPVPSISPIQQQCPKQCAPEEKRGRQEKECSPACDRQLSTTSTTCEDSDGSESRASSASRPAFYKPSSSPFVSFPKHAHSNGFEDGNALARHAADDDGSSALREPSNSNEATEDVPQPKGNSLEEVFRSYCKKNSNGLDSKAFVKLCKKSCLVDKTVFRQQECMLTYSSSVPLDQQLMDFESFQAALKNIAICKGLEESLVHRMVAWSQQQNSDEILYDGQEHTWPKQSNDVMAPPPTPMSSSIGTPKLKRASSLSSVTSASFRKDSSPAQKRSSKLFPSMPLTPVVARSTNSSSPSAESMESSSMPNLELTNAGEPQSGAIEMPRKKSSSFIPFTSMPLTPVLQTSNVSPKSSNTGPRLSLPQALHHSNSVPSLPSNATNNTVFEDQSSQRIWPSMPLCPVIRAH